MTPPPAAPLVVPPSPATVPPTPPPAGSGPRQEVRPALPPLETAPPRRGRGWIWLLAWCGLGVGGYFAYPSARPYVEPLLDSLTHKSEKAPAGPPGGKTVPVVTVAARQGDMDLYLNGLGTVTAFYTVTLRSRVAGELLAVHFKEGQMVEPGALLAEIDPRAYQVQLDEAKAQLERDKAALEVAQSDLKRYTSLQTGGTFTQQELDAQRALVKQGQATLAVDQAQVDNANLQLTYARIVAPIGGRIGLRTVDPGNMVHANDVTGLATITQLQPIALVFTIPQDDIVRVQQAMKNQEKLVVEAWDRDVKHKLADGALSAIDNQVDQTTGTLRLKAVFDNEDESLFPNQFVNARLLVGTRRDAVIIPTAAVQRGPDMTFVYVVKSDSTVELRHVVAGPAEGTETVIESGLAPREVVVTDGLDKLQPGTKVAPRDAAGEPTVTAAPRSSEKAP